MANIYPAWFSDNHDNTLLTELDRIHQRIGYLDAEITSAHERLRVTLDAIRTSIENNASNVDLMVEAMIDVSNRVGENLSKYDAYAEQLVNYFIEYRDISRKILRRESNPHSKTTWWIWLFVGYSLSYIYRVFRND